MVQAITNLQWYWQLLIGWLVFINLVTLITWYSDKRRAIKNKPRTPEARLLMLAFFGGSLAALFGSAWFRHKSKKLSFKLKLWLVVLVQLAAIGTWLWKSGYIQV